MFYGVNVCAARFTQLGAVHFGSAGMSYSTYSCSNSRAVPAPDAAPKSKRAGPAAGGRTAPAPCSKFCKKIQLSFYLKINFLPVPCFASVPCLPSQYLMFLAPQTLFSWSLTLSSAVAGTSLLLIY